MHAQDRYKTILVIVTGLLAVSWIFHKPIITTIALWVGVASIFIPAVARIIEWLWFKLAFGLGWINSRILLSLVFFLVLLPLAWFSRMFSKDILNVKKKHGSSLFHTRLHRYRKKDLENIW